MDEEPGSTDVPCQYCVERRGATRIHGILQGMRSHILFTCNRNRSETLILPAQEGITTLYRGHGHQAVVVHFQNNNCHSGEVNQSRIGPPVGQRRAHMMIQQTQSRLLIGKRQHAQWEERRASPRVIAALGAVAETWETLTCPSARGRHEKVRQICTVEYDAAIK